MHIFKHTHTNPHIHKTITKQKQIQVQLTLFPCLVRGNFQLFCYLLVWVFRKHGEMIASLFIACGPNMVLNLRIL